MWSSLQWELSAEDFLSVEEVKALRFIVRREALRGKRWRRARVLERMVIEVGLQTGLRVKEISDLHCGDVVLNGSMSFLRVRLGKGGIPGVVRVGKELACLLREYLTWKEQNNEATSSDSPLFVSSHTGRNLRKRAIQNIFYRCCKKAGITRRVHAHMMRHTYASILYSKSGHNLRLVQQQLRHKSSRTTEAYANVLNDAYKALDKLYD